jgi:hypothetical protein
MYLPNTTLETTGNDLGAVEEWNFGKKQQNHISSF